MVEEEDDKALRSTNGTVFEEVRASALIKRVTAIIISEKEKKAIATCSAKAGKKNTISSNEVNFHHMAQ